MTSERMGEITDSVLWWPLIKIEKMPSGALKFVAIVLALLLLAVPFTLLSLPFMGATLILEIWEEAHK